MRWTAVQGVLKVWRRAGAGARIKLMRCIDIGQSQEVDEKRVARVPGQKQRSSPFGAPITDPFDNGQLNQGMAAGGVLGRVAGAFKQQPAFRVWGARPLKPPLFSLGVGASLELDQAGLLPHMRVRFQDWATLKVPCPPHSWRSCIVLHCSLFEFPE